MKPIPAGSRMDLPPTKADPVSKSASGITDLRSAKKPFAVAAGERSKNM